MLHKISNSKIAIGADEYLVAKTSRAQATKTFQHFRFNTQQFQNSFFPKTIRDWNHLSPALRCQDSMTSFTKGVVAIFD